MTPLAISTGDAILAWVGLALGLVVLFVVIVLFGRVLRPAREIDAYSRDILAAGVGIATNLDGTDELGKTRSLATAVPGLAVAYLRKLGLLR
jgi:cytochrome oxidase Cu insertion factor (SCO1/SenC/PrrC family)